MQEAVLFITRNPEKLGNAVIRAFALFNFSNFEIILNPIDKGHDRNSLSPPSLGDFYHGYVMPLSRNVTLYPCGIPRPIRYRFAYSHIGGN